MRPLFRSSLSIFCAPEWFLSLSCCWVGVSVKHQLNLPTKAFQSSCLPTLMSLILMSMSEAFPFFIWKTVFHNELISRKNAYCTMAWRCWNVERWRKQIWAFLHISVWVSHHDHLSGYWRWELIPAHTLILLMCHCPYPVLMFPPLQVTLNPILRCFAHIDGIVRYPFDGLEKQPTVCISRSRARSMVRSGPTWNS